MRKIFSVDRKYFLVLPLIMALLVLAACSSTATTAPASTTPPTTPPATSNGQGITINLIAQGMAFDQSSITVPAGASVSMVFNNKDGIPHNFALYTDSTASTSIFVGQTITGPKTITYTFTAPSTPGSYFFRCDVHPTSMKGTFVVQ